MIYIHRNHKFKQILSLVKFLLNNVLKLYYTYDDTLFVQCFIFNFLDYLKILGQLSQKFTH